MSRRPTSVAVQALVLMLSTPVAAESGTGVGLQQRFRKVIVRRARLKRLRPRPRPRRHRPPPRTVGWGSGERLTFEVSIEGIEAARSAIAVGARKRRSGRSVLKIRAMGETIPFVSGFYRMREEQVSLVALDQLSPLRTTSKRIIGSKTREIETRHGAVTEQRIIKRNRPEPPVARTQRRRRIRRRPFDPLSALFHLRSQPSALGQRTVLWILAGTALYEVQLSVAARERIDSKLGIRPCLRLDGTARRIFDDGRPIPSKPPRKLSLWLTDDEARLPLRVAGETKLGLVDAKISSYEPPTQRLSLRLLASAFFASTPASSVRK